MRTVLLALLLTTLPVSALAQTDDRPTVMVIGDSHIERLGPMISRSVEDAGFRSLGSVARRGWSTRRYMREDDMVARLTENGRPDIVVISLGGNDRARDRERYEAELSWVVAQAREAGARRIVWLGPAASDTERSERAEMVSRWHEGNADLQAEILPQLGVEWIDSRPFTQVGHGRDGIHFTVSAYSSWCHVALAKAHLDASPDSTDTTSTTEQVAVAGEVPGGPV